MVTNKKNQKIAVLFLLPSLKRAGAETQTVELINNINRDKFSIYVVTFQEDLSLIDRLNTEGITFQHIPRPLKFSVGFLFVLRRFVLKHKIRLMHCTLQFSLLVAALSTFGLPPHKKPKLLCAIHTTKNVDIKNELADRFIYSKLLHKCSAVIFVCKAQKKYWMARFSGLESRSTVVYNGVDTNRFNPALFDLKEFEIRQRFKLPANAFVISCVAGFRPEKRHDILLRVMSRLPENIHLLLAGDGPLKKQTKAYAEKLGIHHRIHFLGNLSDIRPVLAVSNVSVLSSTAVETFSIAMLESLSMDTPVIAPDIGGLKEAIGKLPDNGSVYPIGDEDSFYNLLNSMLSSSNKNRQGAIRQCVIENFDNQVMVADTVKIIKKVLLEG